MLRLTELKLPLDHDEGALRAAVLHRLALAPDDLISFRIWRRSWDARKRSDIQLIYTIDVEVRNDQAILKRFKGDHNIGPAPDTNYQPVAKAPAAMTSRPIVIGTGPCGCSRAWSWPRWAFGRSSWSAARSCASAPRTPGASGDARCCNPESNVQFGEGGAGTFSDGKLYSQIKDPQHLRPQGAGRVRQGRRAGGDPVRRASRTSAPSGW